MPARYWLSALRWPLGVVPIAHGEAFLGEYPPVGYQAGPWPAPAASSASTDSCPAAHGPNSQVQAWPNPRPQGFVLGGHARPPNHELSSADPLDRKSTRLNSSH